MLLLHLENLEYDDDDDDDDDDECLLIATLP